MARSSITVRCVRLVPQLIAAPAPARGLPQVAHTAPSGVSQTAQALVVLGQTLAARQLQCEGRGSYPLKSGRAQYS